MTIRVLNLVQVDILVANAGKGHYGTVHRTAFAEIRDQLEVNVASTVSLIRLMVPRMILRRQQLKASLALQQGIQAIHKERHRHEGIGGGRIVVVSSIAGAGPGADIAVYSAAKSFLTTFALVSTVLFGLPACFIVHVCRIVVDSP